MSRLSLLLLTVLAAALGACGQIGPLYMPPPEPAGEPEQFAEPSADRLAPPALGS